MMKISELLKAPTITSTTGKKGINRQRANRITDPRGYFSNSSSYYSKVEEKLSSGQERRKALSQMSRAGAVSDLVNQEYGLGFSPMKGAYGGFSTILVHPRLDYILKLFDSNDSGYLSFLKTVVTNPQNPHFPRLRGRPVQLGGNWMAVRMERLMPYPQSRFDDIEFLLDKAVLYPNWQSTIAQDSVHGEFLEKWPSFAEALDLLRDQLKSTKGITSDWHQGNIMQRADGTPVIIDPFSRAAAKPVAVV